ncbi:unnamed protein product [Mytilus coruscus]|uniref:DZIP3-like HEPN domain-containing protein n=1 Tax=Mytilus coruscus TaxID=42192 RepID=A0A6J8C506_MYTCO|nr:unnamed protein product [Mytilus coruscus]
MAAQSSQMNKSQRVPKTPSFTNEHPLEDIDDVHSQENNNYMKLVLLIVDVASNVLREYITKKKLKGKTFESFLNERAIKHALFQCCQSKRCCARQDSFKYSKTLTVQQLMKMYNQQDMSKALCNFQKCACHYTAKQGIKVQVLDITLANCFFDVEEDRKVIQCVKKLTQKRNELFHLSDLKELLPITFDNDWEWITVSIMAILNEIDQTEYSNTVYSKITAIFKSKLIEDPYYMLQYERLCRDYWETKLKEFEEKESKMCENFKTVLDETKTADLQDFIMKLPTLAKEIDLNLNVFGRSNLEKLEEETSEENDQKDVYVPVLLHLKVPTEWSRSRIKDAVRAMRLQGTYDMAINIKAVSTDDLNIVAEILRKTLGDDQKLRDEIEKFIGSILLGAEINEHESDMVVIDMAIANNNESLSQEQRQRHENQFHQIEVQFIRKFQLIRPASYVTAMRDCVVTNNMVVVINYYNDNLAIYDMDKPYDPQCIKLSSKPFGVVTIQGDDVGVSFNKDKCYIEIIDIKKQQVKKTIHVNGIGKMSYQDEIFYVVIDGKKINGVNLNGKEVVSFSSCLPDITNITTDKDRLFLTYSWTNELQCWSLSNMSIIWTFKNEKMSRPSHVVIDANHNLYVTGQGSKNVLIVSSDGQLHKEVLTLSQTKKHDLLFPITIHYDKLNNSLLAFKDFNDTAVLYKIIS